MMRSILVFAGIIIIALSQSLQAQETFEDWKKKQEEEYQSFKEKRDKEFVKFLKEEWKFVDSYSGEGLYDESKPDELPEADKNEERPDFSNESPKIDIPERSPGQAVEESPEKDIQTDKPDTETVETQTGGEQKSMANFNKANFTFFKESTQWRYDPAMKVNFKETSKKKKEGEIGKFWEILSKTQYGPLLKQCHSKKEEMNLNDWGYTLMLYSLGGTIYGDNTPEQRLFTWFMLAKSDYNARIGYNENTIRILLPIKNGLFNTSYYTVNNTKYYSVRLEEDDKKAPSLYTYEGSYPGAEENIDMQFYDTPNLEGSYNQKKLKFTYEGKSHQFEIPYNSNLLDFYKDYPQTDLGVYFSAPVNEKTSEKLLDQLEPLVKDKNEAEAVNLILRFVQTAFDYKVDEKQFGREKYMVPEETLYYPYSDCEDRSVLFAYLVRNLTGLDVIGIKYPGHLATAVKFSKHTGGDSVTWNGETYTVADPTYVNADIGMSMDKYKDKKPDIVKIP